MDTNLIVEETLNWIRTVVIGLNFCPFAAPTLKNDSLPIKVSHHSAPQAIAKEVEHALMSMAASDVPRTSILVTPEAFPEFMDYNDFLNTVDALIEGQNLQGVIQVASFHPRYTFAHTHQSDPANFTNRSPYPMFHFLREDDIAEAVEAHPDTLKIPRHNIEACNEMGYEAMRELLQNCYLVDTPNRPTSGE